VIGQQDTTTAGYLDQIFNTFDEVTRGSLQNSSRARPRSTRAAKSR
jgi:hypothetical protein